ncbi:stage III sporulation protein AA [Virgibacillus halophilus]|uniref:Stage III sporulation protein AA n=1 Tax=Tigheibacillus halophilus TaxID=361280 RepID=A0ABU5CB67_9BACI|nr:stage III sporulation protein AA [Virgibacillus halophilus]
MENILDLFPDAYRRKIDLQIAGRWSELQEIRLRLAQPVELVFDQYTEWVTGLRPDKSVGMYVVNQLSGYSLYRLEDELRLGYITITGGHRVGLAGKVNTINGNVAAIQDIAFLNIRIAKEKIGIAEKVMPYIFKDAYMNTMLIGAPQTGKTTLLRDVARMVSEGWQKVRPCKVGIIDERSEIAASINGIPQHRVGHRTDVLDACPKAEGMMMMVRSMSPEVLIVDEIGSVADVEALMEAIHAGVKIICTVHGSSVENLMKRPSIKPLLESKVFQRMIILNKNTSLNRVAAILDQDNKNVMPKFRVGYER